jgi:hypothetical protein
MDDLHEAAVEAAGVAGWAGTVLPACRVSSFQVFPVVQVLPEASSRLREGQQPELDASVLAMWESWPVEDAVQPPRSAVVLEGFILPYKWKAAARAAGRLCGYGKVMALTGVNGEKACSAIRLMEADLAGLTVVHVARDGLAELQVKGRESRHPRAKRSLADRYFEEVFFAKVCSAAFTHQSVLA